MQNHTIWYSREYRNSVLIGQNQQLQLPLDCKRDIGNLVVASSQLFPLYMRWDIAWQRSTQFGTELRSITGVCMHWALQHFDG